VLHPKLRLNGKHYLPPASYSLTIEEEKALCQCLHRVWVPTGFSSNISKLVSVKDLSMFDYNSHDCHMMMMVFLTITIRVIKLMCIKVLTIRLCYFFNTVSQKVIGRKELNNLKSIHDREYVHTWDCFSPFFDMQEHLMIHLVDQILILGPLYLHSIFSYERFLAVLKTYVWNHAHLEGSIMEGYTTEGVVKCCVDYVKDGK
jgi:hypothetical protein